MILRPFHILFRLMIFAVVIGSTSACSSFGGDHTESDLDRYRKSPQYSVDQERFVNDRQEIIDQMKDKMFTWDGLTRRMFKGEHKVPEQKLPEETVSRDFFSSDSEKGKVIWLGHSSFLLRIDQKTILIDPVFANAGPFSFVGKRFQEPVLKLEDIPKVDLVLISHDHYDHLEMKTVRHLKDKGTRFIVPIGIGRHLAYWGVPQDRIHEKDWWQTETIGNLTITTAPARHYSGRSGFLDNDTLWASYVITNGVTNLYFSGDSGYGEHFREIGQKLGPFDIAFLENGQYHEISREVHMYPEDVIKAFQNLNAKHLFPIHWGVFALSKHSWFEPIVKIRDLAEAVGVSIVVPKFGQEMDLAEITGFNDWWSSFIPQ